jgi:ParB family chromosome partitioning protein
MAHTLTTVRLDKLNIPAEAPRVRYSEEGFKRLKKSIDSLGLLVPLIARAAGGGEYFVVDGSTRLGAVRALDWAGDRELPVYVLDGDDADAVAASVVINQVRERLSLRGELRALRHLVSMGLTQDAAGEALGKNRWWAQRMLKLDELPEALKDEVTEGGISVSHGLIIAEYLDHPTVVEMLATLARSKQASGAVMKRMAREALKVGAEAAMARRPRRDKVGGHSWIRSEPLRNGRRLEVHWNEDDDPELVIARMRKLMVARDADE